MFSNGQWQVRHIMLRDWWCLMTAAFYKEFWGMICYLTAFLPLVLRWKDKFNLSSVVKMGQSVPEWLCRKHRDNKLENTTNVNTLLHGATECHVWKCTKHSQVHTVQEKPYAYRTFPKMMSSLKLQPLSKGYVVQLLRHAQQNEWRPLSSAFAVRGASPALPVYIHMRVSLYGTVDSQILALRWLVIHVYIFSCSGAVSRFTN